MFFIFFFFPTTCKSQSHTLKTTVMPKITLGKILNIFLIETVYRLNFSHLISVRLYNVCKVRTVHKNKKTPVTAEHHTV